MKEKKVSFPILVDDIDDTVRRLYCVQTSAAFIVSPDGTLVYKSSWTWRPNLELTLREIVAVEKARARNEMVRMWYSEKLVALTRN
jgi:hypothetical protein